MGDLSLGEFEAFFHYYECDIFSYLARMTGDEAAAYDLSQETFIRAWRSFDKIRGYNQPRAWLFRVASNLALNHLRQRRGALGGATSLEHMIDPASSDPAWRLAERDAVRATLLDLAPRQRAALVLREVYGLSCVEVGQTLGISTAAAKMALLRARVTFKARYQRADASDIWPGPRS
ncbi:MAG TPA: sigma-70 family RNA polymerase sigma factor [Ktedonobacterales bacterium]|jgi:RNA polymerase sigma-70 factor (ECF subfamily)